MNTETLQGLILALMQREDRDLGSHQHGKRGLTLRQLGVMLTVYLYVGPHTTSSLASNLKIPKPAVSRALYRLRSLGLIERKRCDFDLRVLEDRRTESGRAFLQVVCEIAADKLNRKTSP